MNRLKRILGDVFNRVDSLLGAGAAGRKVGLAIALVVTLLSLALFAWEVTGGTSAAGFSFIENIELRSLDARFRLRGERPHDPRIVIVGIDEKTLQNVGAWPIPRNAYAKLVDRLSADGASIVGFDITFPTPEKNSAIDALKQLEQEIGPGSPGVLDKIRAIERTSDNDAIFADSIKRAGNVILGVVFLDRDLARQIDPKAMEEYYNSLWAHPFPQMLKVSGASNFDLSKAWCGPLDSSGTCTNGPVEYGIESNIALLSDAARSLGYFNYLPDSDGTFRHAQLLMRYRNREWYPSLPLEVVRQYEDIKDQSLAAYMAPNGLERIDLGPHVLHTTPSGSMLINYTGPSHTYATYSMADVIDGKLPASDFKDKIVLVGATAVGIGDLRITPFQSVDYMGVEIHANVIDNLLHSSQPGRGFLSRGLNEEMIDIVIILAFGLGLGWVFTRLKPLSSTFSMVGALAAFLFFNYFCFAHYGMWLSLVIPSGTLIVNYGSITSYRMIFEEREKRRVRKTFERYVSPGVIRLIEQDPKKYFKPGGESKELTIMFSDIRSFTSISEGLTPNELVRLLNEYLGEMTDILFKRWGTLDKYIGDAVMAFWGSPFPQEDHAVRACACALDMSARLEELNLKWELGGRKPLSIGLGINTGQVSVGNMGSERRFSWTVMGDPVNLASRLEGLNKEYHTTRIVSENTYSRTRDHFLFRELDCIRVKGKLKPVVIYELVGWPKDHARFAELLSLYEEARVAYQHQVWDEAAQRFETVLSRYPNDGPSQVFLQRALEFVKESPVPGWDGVYVMKTK